VAAPTPKRKPLEEVEETATTQQAAEETEKMVRSPLAAED